MKKGMIRETLRVTALNLHWALLVFFVHPVFSQIEGDASVRLQSDFAFRGAIEDRDGVLIPAAGLDFYNGWQIDALGVWSYQVPAASEQDGEFSRVHVSVTYSFPLDYGVIHTGLTEYLFPGGDEMEDTRELFLLLYARMDFLHTGLDAYWDVDEKDDVYAALWARTDFLIGHELGVGFQNTFGFSGDGYTSTGRSGARDWTIRLDSYYPLTERSELGIYAECYLSLDDEVFPEGQEDWLAGFSYQRLF